MLAELEAPIRPFASRAGSSIRSFNLRGSTDRGTSSSPPSIGGDSTRRKTFGLPSILGRRGKAAPIPLPLDSAALKHNLQSLDHQSNSSEAHDPARRPAAPGTAHLMPSQALPPPLSPTSPKSPSSRTTMFRKFTTKFTRARSRSRSPPPAANKRRSVAVDVDNVAVNAARNRDRDAALRARGLLPALPLSVQEARQDSRIAVVALPSSGSEPMVSAGIARNATEASRIKDQWEAKNRATVVVVKDESESDDDEKARFEADAKKRLTVFRFGGNSPAASPVKEVFPAVDENHPPSSNVDAISIDKLPISSPLLQPWSDTPPPELDPAQLPLPPSPRPTTVEFSSLISAFAAPVTPPSPPEDLEVVANEPSQARTAVVTAAPTPSASESSHSLGVPSLVAHSIPSAASSSESPLPQPLPTMRSVNFNPVRNSTIELKPHTVPDAIQVVIETPVEQRADPFETYGVEMFRSTSPLQEELEFSVAFPSSESEGPAVMLSPAPPPSPRAALRRRETAPEESTPAAGERRKSLLTSFRKSVVAFGRANTTATKRKSAKAGVYEFDASMLPPSPTLPVEFANQQQQKRASSLNPTMHSTGTIMHETSRIEDAETRRMTELAFM
ncbi:F-box domain-containing protein [Mycena chlorophos]|uniref:F-box domain-containing protein n=1 Tax=Mycena chlorophos TaxID=658473 RepID=A0A8H6S1I7_MYCCL|nr:F-box domain-containing protein [Mycena chlorophos]